MKLSRVRWCCREKVIGQGISKQKIMHIQNFVILSPTCPWPFQKESILMFLNTSEHACWWRVVSLNNFQFYSKISLVPQTIYVTNCYIRNNLYYQNNEKRLWGYRNERKRKTSKEPADLAYISHSLSHISSISEQCLSDHLSLDITFCYPYLLFRYRTAL